MSRSNKVVFRATLVVATLVLAAIYFVVTSTTSVANRTLFTGNEHHQVTLDQAQRWTAEFQKTTNEGQLIAGYFGKNIFEKILNQDKVTGIRIYKAKHDNGDEVFVLVGVDGKGNDVVSGVVGEGVLACPPFCGWDPSLQQGVRTSPIAFKK